jgi:RimJ/RimL family protein N-acetyltransferase
MVSVPRVAVRHAVEADRSRFVELFCDEDFMAFSDGVLSRGAAEERFDQMVARCAEVSFAKQPIVELSSGVVVGYTGVDWIDLDGRRWLEWGYRLVPAARGKGYATEASKTLLTRAAGEYTGDLLAIIHRDNQPSQNVCRKLGFRYWKTAGVNGEPRNLYLMRLGAVGS